MKYQPHMAEARFCQCHASPSTRAGLP